jgi:hypothetical protein
MGLEMTVFGGDVIYAADLNAIEARLPQTFNKAVATDRVNNTMTADPELAGIPLAVGTYEIDLVLMWTQLTTNTQKLRTQWGFSGTWNTPIRAVMGPGSAATSARTDVAEMQDGGYASNVDALYSVAAGAGFAVVREWCRLVTVTVAGNLSLIWAQNTTSANITSVKAGTSFVTRKIT